MKSFNNVVIVQQSAREPFNFGFVPMLICVGFLCLIINYFWQIVAVAAVVLVMFVFYLLFRDQQLRRRELAMRADEQNRQFLAGDPRGVYGVCDEGFER